MCGWVSVGEGSAQGLSVSFSMEGANVKLKYSTHRSCSDARSSSESVIVAWVGEWVG